MVINPVIFSKDHSSDIFSENLNDNVIHLVGPVTDELSASIVAQLLHLDQKADWDNPQPIQLYINSPGGSVSAGLAIYDTMQFLRSPIQTVCLGHAASMAAVLLSGGTKGSRIILPNAEVMIHQPSGGMEGQTDDMLIAAEHIRATRNTLNRILAQNTGRTIEEIARDTDRDHWMSAEEAVAYGVVDRIITKKTEETL